MENEIETPNLGELLEKLDADPQAKALAPQLICCAAAGIAAYRRVSAVTDDELRRLKAGVEAAAYKALEFVESHKQ
jgi:hypothetical protein